MSGSRQSEAGRKNLAKWKAENPAGGALKHGAHSKIIRQRYSDKRTREGRQLAAVIQGLVDDLGGHANITNTQRLLLENIKAKLIVLFQIGQYVDRQTTIVNPKGELLPCLNRNFTTYSEALRRDLEALSAMGKKSVPVSYEKALRALEGGKR